MADIQPVAVWKRVVASVLDFLLVFFVAGYLIARITGHTTENGFALDGLPALVLFAVLGGYFYVGRRIAGGTLFDRLFGIGRPQPH